ncbi:MAG: glycosyltransferase family 2 protein [Patescibacteria group bacterium]
MNEAKITVLMPVYNGESYLGTAIESILKQTYKGYEFLIIDDASTDSSLEIIKSYKDARIRLIHNAINVGLNKNLNIGLAAAQGEYIARMDQDDISYPERLSKQFLYLEQNPDVGVCGTAVKILDKKGKKPNLVFPAENNLIRWSFCFYNTIAHPTVMMRKKIIYQVKGYSVLDRAQYAEDYDLWSRLLPITKFHNLKEPLLTLRKHDSNMTVLNLEINLNNAGLVNRRILEYFLKHKISLDLISKLKTKNEIYFDQINSTIFELTKIFKTGEDLTPREKKIIISEAARRLLYLFFINLKNRHGWKFLKMALKIDPLLLIHNSLYLLNRQ